MSRPDYRVNVKVRNNNILRAAEDLGLSIPKLAERAGIQYALLNDLVNMTLSPFGKNGVRWQVEALCLTLGKSFDELFSSEQCEALVSNKSEAEVTAEQVFAITSGSVGHASIEHDDGFAEAVSTVLDALSDRERYVIDRRFGMDGVEMTLDQLAIELGISSQRVRQIEHSALRKMRHPELSGPIRTFVGRFA